MITEEWVFLIIGVIIGAVLANAYRRWFPWLFNISLFFAWYSNHIMVRPRLAKSRLVQRIYSVLQKRIKVDYINIFEIFSSLHRTDDTPTKVFFREVDAILDRHIAGLCTSQYAVSRVNEVYQQFLEYKKQQESQRV